MDNSKKKCRGSLTVEASFAFPIFFFAFMIFLYLLQVLFLQEHIQYAMTETVQKASKYAYVYDHLLSTKESEIKNEIPLGGMWVQNIMEDTFLTLQFAKEVNKDKINGSCINGGVSGISFTKSSVMKVEKEIDAVAEYKISLSVPLLSLFDFTMVQRVKSRGFVGKSYDVKGLDDSESDGEMVYITPTGKAYHQSQNCTYIKIILQTETYHRLEQIRNDSGGKYYACERCVGNGTSKDSIIYVTSYGTRYHQDKKCSGIKRTVKTVLLSEVGDRHACSRCYGKKEES